MLINISNLMQRSEIEMEIDFKVIQEFYISGRRSVGAGLERRNDFLLNEFIFHPLENVNLIRMEAILQNKVVLKNIFIRDVENGKVIYYGRLKTDTEKFAEATEGLF